MAIKTAKEIRSSSQQSVNYHIESKIMPSIERAARQGKTEALFRKDDFYNYKKIARILIKNGFKIYDNPYKSWFSVSW